MHFVHVQAYITNKHHFKQMWWILNAAFLMHWINRSAVYCSWHTMHQAILVYSYAQTTIFRLLHPRSHQIFQERADVPMIINMVLDAITSANTFCNRYCHFQQEKQKLNAIFYHKTNNHQCQDPPSNTLPQSKSEIGFKIPWHPKTA